MTLITAPAKPLFPKVDHPESEIKKLLSGLDIKIEDARRRWEEVLNDDQLHGPISKHDNGNRYAVNMKGIELRSPDGLLGLIEVLKQRGLLCNIEGINYKKISTENKQRELRADWKQIFEALNQPSGQSKPQVFIRDLKRTPFVKFTLKTNYPSILFLSTKKNSETELLTDFNVKNLMEFIKDCCQTISQPMPFLDCMQALLELPEVQENLYAMFEITKEYSQLLSNEFLKERKIAEVGQSDPFEIYKDIMDELPIEIELHIIKSKSSIYLEKNELVSQHIYHSNSLEDRYLFNRLYLLETVDENNQRLYAPLRAVQSGSPMTFNLLSSLEDLESEEQEEGEKSGRPLKKPKIEYTSDEALPGFDHLKSDLGSYAPADESAILQKIREYRPWPNKQDDDLINPAGIGIDLKRQVPNLAKFHLYSSPSVKNFRDTVKEQLFRWWIKKFFTVQEIPADNSCLFHALFKGADISATNPRAELMGFMRKSLSYVPFIVDEELQEFVDNSKFIDNSKKEALRTLLTMINSAVSNFKNQLISFIDDASPDAYKEKIIKSICVNYLKGDSDASLDSLPLEKEAIKTILSLSEEQVSTLQLQLKGELYYLQMMHRMSWGGELEINAFIDYAKSKGKDIRIALFDANHLQQLRLEADGLLFDGKEALFPSSNITYGKPSAEKTLYLYRSDSTHYDLLQKKSIVQRQPNMLQQLFHGIEGDCINNILSFLNARSGYSTPLQPSIIQTLEQVWNDHDWDPVEVCLYNFTGSKHSIIGKNTNDRESYKQLHILEIPAILSRPTYQLLYPKEDQQDLLEKSLIKMNRIDYQPLNREKNIHALLSEIHSTVEEAFQKWNDFFAAEKLDNLVPFELDARDFELNCANNLLGLFKYLIDSKFAQFKLNLPVGDYFRNEEWRTALKELNDCSLESNVILGSSSDFEIIDTLVKSYPKINFYMIAP